jgi:hypothetical protein
VKRKRKTESDEKESIECERKVQGQCANAKCRRKCISKIDDKQQDVINKAFWNMGTKERRHDFVSSYTNKQSVSTRTKCQTSEKNKNRESSYFYFLPTNSNERVSVCKRFFLNTLDISDVVVRQANNHNVSGATHTSTPVIERRGGHNKTKSDCLLGVRAHIESFPCIDSHYCRATRVCQYLEGTLSISSMYRLYKEKCISEEKDFVQENVYRSVFVTEFNLRFNQPAKDSCDTCSKFELRRKENGGLLTPENELAYNAHMRRKDQARNSKLADKESASATKVCIAMDLEQVLTVPKLSVGSAYYLRKLSMYNLTFYNLASKEGICYMWTEVDAGRGANEVASALYHWLCEEDKQGAQQIVIYSDTCAGQNRNRIISTMIIFFLHNSINTVVVEQKYFESGHSQNECDSMHSSLENKYRKRDVHLPSQYEQLAREARPKMPYKVVSLSRDIIFDWNAANGSIRANAFSGILTKHHITYRRNEDLEISVQFSDEIGGEHEAVVYKKRGRNIDYRNFMISHAYDAPLGVDKNKKDDLLKLCNFLPNDCKPFYESIMIRD